MYEQIESNKRKTLILIALFIVIILGIGYVAWQGLGLGPESMILALGFSSVMSLSSYFVGDKVALSSAGAKEIVKDDNPYVYRMVENLSITAGLPMPKVYIIESAALNAFATGRSPEHASIAITTGLINALENEELEGVIAHELSHVKNYDIRVMTIVVILVGMLAILSDIFLRFGLFGRRDSDNNKGIGGILAIIGIVLLILSPIIAELIKLAVSRKREYLADASGALLTRYPDGLANALEKISASTVPLKTANAATAHLFISNPFKKNSFSAFMSTHPPIEDRISRLRGMTW